MNYVNTKFRPTPTGFKQLKPCLFTFFAGAGFLDLGFEAEGFDVVFVNEYHKPFLDAYKYARDRMNIAKPMFGYLQDDIGSIVSNTDSEVLNKRVESARRSHGLVGFIGGPPCPDFSVGGKNRGRDGENGALSQTYVNMICEQKPDFFVFENVKGLWRTKVHRQFYEELKLKLSQSGYVLADKLVNSIEFGVPQDRDRIILIGFLQDRFPSVSANFASIFPWDLGKKFDRNVLEADFWPQTENFAVNSIRTPPTEVPRELTVQGWFERNNVSLHPNASDCFVPRAALPKFERYAEGDDSKKCFKRLHRWRYSPTAAYGNNEVHLHPYQARRINVAEALSIQSLPESFCLPPSMTLTDKFKTIGNGVPFLLARGVAMSVQQLLENVA